MRYSDLFSKNVDVLAKPANDDNIPAADLEWLALDKMVREMPRRSNDSFGPGKEVKYVQRPGTVVRSNNRVVLVRFHDDGEEKLIRRQDWALKPGDSLFETSGALPEMVYHGTCRGNWTTHYGSGDLYLAASLETAWSYADEWADAEETADEAIVVAFRLSDLQALGEHRLNPNWEIVQQDADLAGRKFDAIAPTWTWQRSLGTVIDK